VIEMTRSCSRHRPLLVDFVDHGEVRPGTAAALAHLDRCARCTETIEATILTITALRRLGDTTRNVEPPDDAWPRLRARIQALGPRRPAVMSPIAGIAMSVAIVAVLIVPFRFGGGSLLGTAASPTIERSAVSRVDRRIETAYIASVRRIESVTGGSALSADAVAFAHVYPDDIRPTRKEVGPGTTTMRPSEAS
jgi:anti-sigma factor RsiW